MGTTTHPKVGDTVTWNGKQLRVMWANGFGWLRLADDTRVRDAEVKIVQSAPETKTFHRRFP